MGRLFRFILLLVLAFLATYVGIALRAGPKAESPIIKLLGHGDRPAICSARANIYLEKNRTPMESIASALLEAEHLTDVWVMRSRKDANHWPLRNHDDPVEATPEDVETFFPLFV